MCERAAVLVRSNGGGCVGYVRNMYGDALTPMSACASTILGFKYVSTWKDYRHINIPLTHVFVHSIHSIRALKARCFAMFCGDIFNDLLESFAFQLWPQRPAARNYAWVTEDFVSQCFVLVYTFIYSHT